MEHSGSRVSAKMGHSRARHCPFWSGEGSFGALTVVVQTNIPLPYRFLDLLRPLFLRTIVCLRLNVKITFIVYLKLSIVFL